MIQRSAADLAATARDRVDHALVGGRPLDIVSPVTGDVVEVGESLLQHPERINAYPYSRTGLLKIRVDTPREIDPLMRFEDYAALIHRLQQYEEWFKDRRMT